MEQFIVANVIDVCIAVMIDWMVGDPYWFPHPVIYIGKLIKTIENKARALSKNTRQLKLSGGLMVIIVAVVSFLIPAILLYITWTIKPLFHGLNIFFLWTTVAAKSLKVESMKVFHALNHKDIELSRKLTSYIVGRDTKTLDEEQLVRATVETVAENASDGVIAPLFYAVIGAAPLAMLYKGINTMDSMVGYMNEKYKYIGFFPAKTDDVFNFIPARLTGALMCVSAPLMGANFLGAVKIMLRDRKNHKSPNCAYPEAAAAAILGVQLGGSNSYFGEMVEKPTIGDKRKPLKKEDIAQVNKLMFLTEIVFLAISLLFLCYF